MTAARRAPRDLEAPELDAAVAELVELVGLTTEDWQRDVLSFHITHGTVAVRMRGRGPRGRQQAGVTIRRAHRVRPELPED